MPRFSIVIPTYNRAALLALTLASVRAQRRTDYEVIVVDNGSTDGTADLLAGHAAWVRCVPLPQAGRGPGAARNAGARVAAGEYLAFLDSDDLWFPWTLDVFAQLIADHREPALLAAALVTFSEPGELAAISEDAPAGDAYADYLASSRQHCCVGAGTMVVRREAFARSGGFDERPINMEDHDLALRLGTEPGFVAVKRPFTLAWRRHPGSVTLDAAKSYLGARNLVEHEAGGGYPGGLERAGERRQIITGHTRPASLECLRAGRTPEAWWIYRRTFAWNAARLRWKYLLGFPLRAFRSR